MAGGTLPSRARFVYAWSHTQRPAPPPARTAPGAPGTPAVVSAEQSVSNAFTTSGLIPGHVDFKNFSDPGFNDTVGGAS